MMHENDEVLKLAKLLAQRVLELEECANTSTKDECMAQFALDDAAYLARLVTAELSDDDKAGHECWNMLNMCHYKLKVTDPECTGCNARVDN
jgi:hypothetical protein